MPTLDLGTLYHAARLGATTPGVGFGVPQARVVLGSVRTGTSWPRLVRPLAMKRAATGRERCHPERNSRLAPMPVGESAHPQGTPYDGWTVIINGPSRNSGARNGYQCHPETLIVASTGPTTDRCFSYPCGRPDGGRVPSATPRGTPATRALPAIAGRNWQSVVHRRCRCIIRKSRPNSALVD